MRRWAIVLVGIPIGILLALLLPGCATAPGVEVGELADTAGPPGPMFNGKWNTETGYAK
jgi:hypothetical protein